MRATLESKSDGRWLLYTNVHVPLAQVVLAIGTLVTSSSSYSGGESDSLSLSLGLAMLYLCYIID